MDSFLVNSYDPETEYPAFSYYSSLDEQYHEESLSFKSDSWIDESLSPKRLFDIDDNNKHDIEPLLGDADVNYIFNSMGYEMKSLLETTSFLGDMEMYSQSFDQVEESQQIDDERQVQQKEQQQAQLEYSKYLTGEDLYISKACQMAEELHQRQSSPMTYLGPSQKLTFEVANNNNSNYLISNEKPFPSSVSSQSSVSSSVTATATENEFTLVLFQCWACREEGLSTMYDSEENLRVHLAESHSLFQCSQCEGRIYRRKGDLSKHLRNKHHEYYLTLEQQKPKRKRRKLETQVEQQQAAPSIPNSFADVEDKAGDKVDEKVAEKVEEKVEENVRDSVEEKVEEKIEENVEAPDMVEQPFQTSIMSAPSPSDVSQQSSSPPVTTDLWPCFECDRAYQRIGDLSRHIRRSHPIIKLVCHLCEPIHRPEPFSSLTTLSRHYRSVHYPIKAVTASSTPPPERIYRCTFEGCNKFFASNQRLTAHGAIHRERSHVCATCGHSFIYPSKLKAHEQTHEKHRLLILQAQEEEAARLGLNEQLMAIKDGAGTLLENSENFVDPGASISAAPPTVTEQEVKEVTIVENDQETEDEMNEEDYQVMMGIFSQ